MELVDSHAHLTGTPPFDQIDALLKRAQNASITAIVNICTDPLTLERGLTLSCRYPWVVNSAATTPHDVEREGESAFPPIATAARQNKLVAVGETGLDYYYTHSPKELQQSFCRRYLALALECQLPVIIHCREAFVDLFSLLDSDYTQDGRHAPGVLHCFTGSPKEAEGVIERGWLLSLSGIVTFKKSEELRQIARMVPLKQLLIETDTPYLAPQSHRGEQNEPAYLLETAKVIAHERQIPLEELASATTSNARRLFSL